MADKTKQFYVNTVWIKKHIKGLVAPCGICSGRSTHFHLSHGCSCQPILLSLVCRDCGEIKVIYDSEA